MRKSLSVFAISCMSLSLIISNIVTVSAVTYPVGVPTGEVAGGTFNTYFSNMFGSGIIDVVLDYTKGCPSGQVMRGLSNTGILLCVSPGLNVTSSSTLALSGALIGTPNYIAKYTPTGTGINNSQIYDNGTNVGIANISPAYKLDVAGTGSFYGLRVASGAMNGYVLTSDAAGISTWKIAPMPCIPVGTGIDNICYGSSVLQLNTTGFSNTAVGSSSLRTNTSGYNNSAFGQTALQINTTGLQNTAIGSHVLMNNTTGFNNTAIGVESMQSNINGGNNTVGGYQAFAFNINGSNNSVFGYYAGRNLTTGDNNTALGSNADFINTTGSNQLNIANIIFGTGLTGTVGAPVGNVGIGTATPTAKLEIAGQIKITGGSPGAGKTLTSDATGLATWTATVSGSTATGIVSGFGNQNYITKFGSGGVGIYSSQLYDDGFNIGVGTITPGAKLEVVGQVKITGGAPGVNKVLSSDATGLATWVSLSSVSGAWSILGNSGTVAGTNFLGTTDGQDLVFKTNNVEAARILAGGNMGIGTATPGVKLEVAGQVKITGGVPGAGKVLTSDATGLAIWSIPGAGYPCVPGGSMPTNTCYGSGSLFAILNGDKNAAYGAYSLFSLQNGDHNTGIGHDALYTNRNGSRNTAVGYQANYLVNNPSSDNTSIGYRAGYNITTGSNNIAIGSNTNLVTATSDNQLNIGNVIFGVNLNGSVGAPAGNIGIGTNNPTTKLEVAGQVKITGGTPGLGKILTSDAVGLATWSSAPTLTNTWNIIGNSGTVAGTNFIGTTDGQALVFKTNNAEVARILTSGNMGIGTPTPGAKLEVAGQVKITGGGVGSGRVLTSDAAGLATWTTAPSPCIPTGTGTSNSCYGANSLYSNTSGTSNTANGVQSLSANTSGNYNTAIGNSALSSNTTGSNNTANGFLSLYSNITGGGNSANGGWSLYSNTTGSSNTANGYNSLTTNATGSSNTANGYNSLRLSTGNNNSSFGFLAGSTLVSGDSNIFIGYNTQPNIGTGASNQLNIGDWIYGNAGNIGIGVLNPTAKLEVAGQVKITGGAPGVGKILTSDATGLATWSSAPTLTNTWNIIGNSGTVAGTNFVGTSDAIDLVFKTNNIEKLRISSGGNLVGVGYSNTLMGTNQIALGALAGLNMNGTQNSAIGGLSVGNLMNGSHNSAFGGNQSGLQMNGSQNSAIGGINAGYLMTGSQNSAFGGNQVGIWMDGIQNSAFGGYSAGFQMNGSQNSAIGGLEVGRSMVGTQNSAIGGYRAGNSMAGNNNTALGGQYAGQGMLGTYNTAIGSYATITSNISDSVVIGSGARSTQTGAIILGGTGSNVGIGISSPTAKLEVAGQVKIATAGAYLDYRPNAVSCTDGQILSWNNASTRWECSSNAPGISGSGLTTNYLTKWNGTSIANSQLFDNGTNVGIGTAIPGSKLEVVGNSYFNGNVTVSGSLIVDKIVNRTVNNISISGSLLPDTGAPLVYRDIGSAAQRWNNLYLSGQVTIAGGTPGLGKVLTSDATGLAVWSSTISGSTATGITGGTQNYIPKFGTGGTGLYLSQFFDNGTNVGIGTAIPGAKLEVAGQIKVTGGTPGVGKILTSDATGLASWTGVVTATGINIASSVLGSTLYYNGTAWVAGTGIYNTGGNIGIGTALPTSKLTIDSGITGSGGLRLSRISATTTTFSGPNVGLGVDGSGNVVPVSNGDVVVYTAKGRNSAAPIPDPDLPNRLISYNFNTYFAIPTSQSFVVSDGNGAGYNAPYFKENGTSGICSGGASPYDCAIADPVTGLSASPNNSFTMTAKGTTYGYQMALGARGDAPLFARSGKFVGAQTGGLYLSDNVTPTPWQKVLTVPANHVEYFYVNIGYNSQLQAIAGGGNVGIGTSFPDRRLVISASGSATSATQQVQIRRGVQGADASLGNTYGTPYMNIGGQENRVNSLQTIAFGKSGLGAAGYAPAEIGFLTTSVAGSTQGDIVFANRNGTTNVVPTEVMRIESTGDVGIGVSNPTQQLQISKSMNIPATTGASTGVIYKGAARFLHNYTASALTPNLFLGLNAGNFTMTQGYNIGIGDSTLALNTSGFSNMALGYLALSNNTTGGNNAAIGSEALELNQTGNNNVANGFKSLYANLTGGNNTSIGTEALTANDIGSNNTANGYQALNANTSGNSNTAIGGQSLFTNISGQFNTAVGYQALRLANSPSSNTALGYLAGNAITTGASNIVIGANAQVGSPTGSNQLSIGNWLYGSGGNIGIGIAAPTAKLEVAGNFKLGTNGTITTAAGVCTIASTAITTTATTYTCTGVPASTAVAVHCNGAAAFTTPGTTSLYCRANGTINQVVCNTTVANAVATTYKCMWMQ